MRQPVLSPRYAAYCVATGANPVMSTGPVEVRAFVFWVVRQLAVWCKEHGKHRHVLTFADHQSFDLWIAQRYPQPIRPQSCVWSGR